MAQAALKFTGSRMANPKRAPSPAQLAARERFAEMARSGGFAKRRKAAPKRKANPEPDHDFARIGKPFEFEGRAWKVSKYAHNGKTIEAYTTDRKKFERKIFDVSDLMIGRRANPSMAMAAYREAGEFAMTVNGKSRTRFFERTDDAYANSYGFDYRLLSDVTKYGSPVKFTKTRAIVAVDEGADGKPITESWAIRGLKFYNTNPDKSKPRAYVRRVSQATGAPPSKRLTARRKMALEAPEGYFPNPKVKYTNTAKDLSLDERVGYSVHSATMPGHLGFAWFSKKADAVEAAQEASNRTGKQLAVSRMQIHFGPL